MFEFFPQFKDRSEFISGKFKCMFAFVPNTEFGGTPNVGEKVTKQLVNDISEI